MIAHPAIWDAAVVGVPDALSGQCLAGFVLPASGVRSAILGEILAWVAEQLGDYNVPESLTIVREILRNASARSTVVLTNEECFMNATDLDRAAAVIPAGTAHAVAATGGGPGRALVVASPSGFARLITEAGTPDEGSGAAPSAATDMDLFLRVSAELGDEILGPPGALPDQAEIQTKSGCDRPGSSGRRR